MKEYEAVTRLVLPRRTYTIIRVDGRAFHTLLRGADRPFDSYVHKVMVKTAIDLCHEVQGVSFAYTQSDEISLLLTDFQGPHSQPWFGGNVQKMASVAASTATESWVMQYGRGQFDARVYTIPDAVEVANYFVWRQRDAVRNSISMAAQAKFSHKSLQGLNSDQLQEKLFQEAGINWSHYDAWMKRGSIIHKVNHEETVTYTHKATGVEETIPVVRTRWEESEAPHFSTYWNEWLVGIGIPQREMLDSRVKADSVSVDDTDD